MVPLEPHVLLLHRNGGRDGQSAHLTVVAREKDRTPQFFPSEPLDYAVWVPPMPGYSLLLSPVEEPVVLNEVFQVLRLFSVSKALLVLG